MSSTNNTNYTPTRLPADAPPPAHHLHQSSDVLPGAAPIGSRDNAGSDRPLDVQPTEQGKHVSSMFIFVGLRQLC